MAIVNIVNSFSNFLVPSVISFFGSAERTIFWCAFSYLYILMKLFHIGFISVSFRILFLQYLTLCVHVMASFLLLEFLGGFHCRWYGLVRVSFWVTIRMIMIVGRSQVYSWQFTCLEAYR